VGNFAPLLLLFAVLYVFFLVPQGRRRKQAQALQRAVEPGSRVILTSGLYGTVVEIDDDAVVIEAAEGVQLRYAKAAVLRVVPDLDDADDVADSDLEEFEDDLADNDGLDDLKSLDGAEEQTEPDAEVPPPSSSDPFSKRFLKRPPRRQSRGSSEASSDGTDGNDAGSGPVPTT
jgi:preprotein translocase subunit YajC